MLEFEKPRFETKSAYLLCDCVDISFPDPQRPIKWSELAFYEKKL